VIKTLAIPVFFINLSTLTIFQPMQIVFLN
jgi:hypothetical protein